MTSDSPYEGSRVRASVLIRGYDSSLSRFNAATGERDPEPAFFALFEALNWAAAIDDLIGEIWRPEGPREGFDWRQRVRGSEVVDGVRYVRNLVHHHWADALRVEEGARYPKRYPRRYWSWVWRAAEELPPPTTKWDKLRRPAYESLLADRRAEDTLIALGDVFAAVGQMLDPVIAPSRHDPSAE